MKPSPHAPPVRGKVLLWREVKITNLEIVSHSYSALQQIFSLTAPSPLLKDEFADYNYQKQTKGRCFPKINLLRRSEGVELSHATLGLYVAKLGYRKRSLSPRIPPSPIFKARPWQNNGNSISHTFSRNFNFQQFPF